MNTFVNRELKSLELKGIAWLLDTALATRTFVDDKSGDITLYTYAKGGSRKVVWAKHGNKVQRREYQHNARTNTTTLFVDYYPVQPLPTVEELTAQGVF